MYKVNKGGASGWDALAKAISKFNYTYNQIICKYLVGAGAPHNCSWVNSGHSTRSVVDYK